MTWIKNVFFTVSNNETGSAYHCIKICQVELQLFVFRLIINGLNEMWEIVYKNGIFPLSFLLVYKPNKDTFGAGKIKNN